MNYALIRELKLEVAQRLQKTCIDVHLNTKVLYGTYFKAIPSFYIRN